MDNKELNQFYEDVCNLGRVLPNLAASVIYTELNNFKDNPDRVQLILKKYFSSYEPEVHNCMSDDIKKIKRVVPSYPFIHINNDLLAVEEKDNRVQLVLKTYFDSQLKLSKRSLDDISECEASSEKKIKTDDISAEIFEQANLHQNFPTTSETESYTIASDDIDINQLEKSGNNDQNSNIVPEKDHTIEEIPILSTTDIQAFDISQQPNQQIVEINKEPDNQNLNNTSENPSILCLLSSLFPQYSPEVVKTVCENFSIVPDVPPDEATMNMMVQVMLNYNINGETFEQDKTEICDNQIPVSACSSAETNEKILTQEDGIRENEDINLPVPSECDKQLLEGFEDNNQECSTESYKFDELHDYFFQEVVNGFVLDLSRTAENNTAPNNNIIKPATFHPKQNTMSTLSNTDTGKSMTPTKPILKPSMLHRTRKTVLSTNFNTGSKPQIKTSTASVVHDLHNHRLSSKSKPILRPSILQRNCTTASSSRLNKGLTDCRPSTSGLRNGNTIDTASKSSIRVRTDLYDMYFNGPVYDSSSESSSDKDIDDVILVSVDRLSDDTSTNIIQNNDTYNDIVKVEENSTESDEPSSSKIQLPSNLQTTHPFYFKLMEIFPDICPDYLKKYCSEFTGQQTMDDMISVLLNGDYKKRDRPVSPENVLDFEEQHKILQDLFPDADPSYLQHHCERLIDNPENFKHFVSSLIEYKNYPTKADYLKKIKLSAQEKQYTTEFNVEKFLEVIPNPEEHFNDPMRRAVSEDNFDDINYAITYLKNTFSTTVVKDIINVFKNNDYSVIKSAQKLEKLKNMKTKRRPYPVTSCKNIPLLQEIAYVKHKDKILLHIRKKESEKQIAREQAKSAGLMKTCQCCYDDEIMPEDIETCESGKHIFCKECVKRGCEVIIGDGKLEFPCLETCDSFFTLQVLQTVLTPKVFSKMAQRKQMQEVKSAGIEDLESCPFCDFATIPAPGDKIFRCLNDDCMKESCRLCKEPSHIPLRCDEVEKDKDVKMRTYIENKMTEALLRKCYKCGLKFIKESGCNKMTCSCGAMMCYVCNKPVQDYKHFNGQGGDQFHLCPLYSDTHKLHMDAIKQSAESAMKELGVNNTNELKIDPTTDLEQHYRRLAEQNPAIPNVPMIFPNINVIPR